VGHWKVPLSQSAVDLVKKILQPNPMDRCSLAEILVHPWFEAPQSSAGSLALVLSSIDLHPFVDASMTEIGMTTEELPSNQSSLVPESNSTLVSVFSVMNPSFIAESSGNTDNDDNSRHFAVADKLNSRRSVDDL
jgi:serine/threonine protein kinase